MLYMMSKYKYFAGNDVKLQYVLQKLCSEISRCLSTHDKIFPGTTDRGQITQMIDMLVGSNFILLGRLDDRHLCDMFTHATSQVFC